jgi:ribosomal protein S18 acetylase RimI-like enzyme
VELPDAAFIIRRAGTGDAAALAEFAARTFVDTYGAANSAEDLAAHLADAFGERQQHDELADAATVTLVAEHDGAMAAYVQVRRHLAPSCVAEPSPVEIARFYVDRVWHGTGVARKLMEQAHSAARELGGRTLWLGVWERNARGIAFYRKSGFHDVGTQTFCVGSDVQTDRVMVAGVACEDLQPV